MALEDVAESMEGKGWLGALLGAAIIIPAMPTIAKKVRPAAKGAVKGYLAMKEKMGEWMAETGEQWQDLVAEAKAEYDQEAAGGDMMPLESTEPGAGEGGVEPAQASAEGEKGGESAEGKGRSRARKEKDEGAPQPA